MSFNMCYIVVCKSKNALFSVDSPSSYLFTKEYFQTPFARNQLPQSACQQQIEDDHNQHESPTTQLFCQGINCGHSSQGEGSPFMKSVPCIWNPNFGYCWGGGRLECKPLAEWFGADFLPCANGPFLDFGGVQKLFKVGLGHIFCDEPLSSGKC